jgi:hypothetical protein
MSKSNNAKDGERNSKKFETATNKKPMVATTPGFPNKELEKNQGETENLDDYRSVVGKTMYYTSKLAPELSNVARELATHSSNTGKEHWKALERCVGYLSVHDN